MKKIVEVYFIKGGGRTAFIFHKRKKWKWKIYASTVTELNKKIRRLRKRLRLDRGWTIVSDNWKGFNK